MNLTQIPVGQIRPNAYNPNRMETREFDELVAEVRHLGRLPKPVVIRQNSDGFEIIDGEHGWRAAQEIGLDEIPCEIIEADDFEAMRQTWKRNQHGNHSPVLEGRMFRRMMQDRDLSRRQLAREIEVSEGTIRNSLSWADAAEPRNGYAPGEDEQFESLTVRQLRFALSEKLPAELWDRWMEDGAKAFEAPDDHACIELFDWATQHQFIPYFKRHGVNDKTLAAIAGISDFASGIMMEWASNLMDYIRPLMCFAELSDPAKIWTETLRFVQRDDEGSLFIPYAPEQYLDIVRGCCERAGSDDDVIAMINMALDVMYQREGWTKYDQQNPMIIELNKSINAGPAAIRECDLDLNQKRVLPNAYYELESRDLDKETAHSIVGEAIKRIRLRECTMIGAESLKEMGGQRELSEDMKRTGITIDMIHPVLNLDIEPRNVMNEILRGREFKMQIEARNQLFVDREKLLDATVERIRGEHHTVRDGICGDRPVYEILRERLAALPHPEFVLLAGLMLDRDAAVGLWHKTTFPDGDMEAGEAETTPAVVNINTCPSGWQGDPDYIYIGRANIRRKLPESPFHNPYHVGKDGDRQRCIQLFREYLESNPALQAKVKSELVGKKLVCFCAPEPCHGDVLVECIEATGALAAHPSESTDTSCYERT